MSEKENRQYRLKRLDDNQSQNYEEEDEWNFVKDTIELMSASILVIGESPDNSSTKTVISEQKENATHLAPEPSTRDIVDPRESGYPQSKHQRQERRWRHDSAIQLSLHSLES